MDGFLTVIHGYNRTRNRRIDLYLSKYYFILVQNKKTLKKMNMQTVFDEMWYMIEYLIVNTFYFIILFDW